MFAAGSNGSARVFLPQSSQALGVLHLLQEDAHTCAGLCIFRQDTKSKGRLPCVSERLAPAAGGIPTPWPGGSVPTTVQ